MILSSMQKLLLPFEQPFRRDKQPGVYTLPGQSAPGIRIPLVSEILILWDGWWPRVSFIVGFRKRDGSRRNCADYLGVDGIVRGNGNIWVF